MVGDVTHPELGFFRKIGHQTRLIWKVAGVIDSHRFPAIWQEQEISFKQGTFHTSNISLSNIRKYYPYFFKHVLFFNVDGALKDKVTFHEKPICLKWI